MSIQQGTINVQTENIFPIIKKFLYSDHEIFLRELVSNAVDANQKMKALTSLGEFKGELGDLKVSVSLDADKGTLTISDTGIGMSAEEIDKYINQIAFSGAEEFVQKYKDKAEETNAIIGHFGLGFYSAFMVSKKVEIITKSHTESEAVRWECDGSPNFTIEKSDRTERGTDIILHIADDSKEFLENGRIQGILDKYCKFLPIPVVFGTRSESVPDGEDKDGKPQTKSVDVPNQVNNPVPAWTKAPMDLKTEDYNDFYREIYPMNFDDPLFHIHLNVDYPFNLTGILYFPKLKENFEVQKNKIQLYSNQVFITDNVEDIVPEFLTLLHGVIDSPDIPLNVSRSYLQSDSNVKRISNHISKKVSDKLGEMYKNDRADFEQKWEDIKVFIQYGMLSEDKFYDRSNGFALYKNVDGKYFTFEELSEKIKANQTDKDGKVIYLYASNTDEQHSYIQSAKNKGYDVIIMDGPLASHIVTKLEQKHENISFARVDSDTIEKLINKEEEIPSKLSDKEKEELKPVIEEVVEKTKFHVVIESLNESDTPIQITRTEFMRRMKEQQMTGGGGMQMFGNMPETFNLVVNGNHPLFQKVLKEKDAKKRNKIVKQAADLALLSQNMLKGEELTNFIKRSIDLIK
ncbi:MAG: molecular chaperone HtpG [Sphingobacteriales bacterium]|jgi:molecular chaperone HtpG